VERIRLWGIDCPESRQAFGARATQFTGDLAFGKEVSVQVKDVDRYGRTVGVVILPDGRNLNQELVRAGLAWWYRQYAAHVKHSTEPLPVDPQCDVHQEMSTGTSTSGPIMCRIVPSGLHTGPRL
jgi:endonuclease YncB( thermonuclease family)